MQWMEPIGNLSVKDESESRKALISMVTKKDDARVVKDLVDLYESLKKKLCAIKVGWGFAPCKIFDISQLWSISTMMNTSSLFYTMLLQLASYTVTWKCDFIRL